jgi:hypothetical protein
MAFISNGTTILDNGAFSVNLGSMVLLSEQTASSSANISFTSGIDSTYPIYKFEFINIHPSAQDSSTDLVVNYSTDGGSNYNVTQTSTFFGAYHHEGDSYSGLEYYPALDVAQGTNAGLVDNAGNSDDASISGHLTLFNPSSTTFVKHWMGSMSLDQNGVSATTHVAGYGNTTSSINAVQYKFLSGNIDSGTIKLYGIKDS